VTQQRLFIGLMSGTSGDAIDAALVGFDTTGRPHLLAGHQVALPRPIQSRIFDLQSGLETHIERVCELDVDMADLYAQAVNELLTRARKNKASIEAVGNHGQTLLHYPNLGRAFTLQVGDNHRLAECTGIAVVGDFRRRDIAAGGQGAPLVPAFHKTLVNSAESTIFLNIGGIANISVVTAAGVTGFDTGPGNTLLDAWIRQHKKMAFDQGGTWAANGQALEPLISEMLTDSYFSQEAPKSTGQDYFNLAWLERFKLNAYRAEDVQRSLLELTARSIASEINRADCRMVYLSGGGYHNTLLVQRLKDLMPQANLYSSGALGVDPDFMEAMAFAWLAKQCLDGKRSGLPEVTGAVSPRILGVVFPKH
jgi:anhydro-N-acetylmuramic acid kinase